MDRVRGRTSFVIAHRLSTIRDADLYSSDWIKVRSLKKERMRVYWHRWISIKTAITANLLRKQNKSSKNKTV